MPPRTWTLNLHTDDGVVTRTVSHEELYAVVRSVMHGDTDHVLASAEERDERLGGAHALAA